eukprot:1045176-Pelagomonas_calceolata.AAC.5
MAQAFQTPLLPHAPPASAACAPALAAQCPQGRPGRGARAVVPDCSCHTPLKGGAAAMGHCGSG